MPEGPRRANSRRGILKIPDTKKQIIVLLSSQGGATELIESLIKASHLISNCFVYGDGRRYNVALITINETEAANMCREEIHGLVEQAVSEANSRVSGGEQIKRFVILERDFSPEFDEVTPTMKLNRDVVARHFSDVIEKLYEA